MMQTFKSTALSIFLIACSFSSTASGAELLKKCAEENLRNVNAYRKSQGLGSLSMNSEARRRAEAHTLRMASSDYLYHSDSSVFMDYENVAQNWMFDGEKQADISAKVFKQWKNSPGHNKNMLRKDSKYAGIACVAIDGDEYGQKIYATQIFWTKAYGGTTETPGKDNDKGTEPVIDNDKDEDKKPPIVVEKSPYPHRSPSPTKTPKPTMKYEHQEDEDDDEMVEGNGKTIGVLKACAEENLRQVNTYRKSKGLNSLSMNSEARRRAETHTMRMASSDHLYHSDWSVFMDYENVAQNWMFYGEKQADVSAKVFKQWKNSPGHNKNMLRKDSKYAGIACVAMDGDEYGQKIYATQIFWTKAYGGTTGGDNKDNDKGNGDSSPFTSFVSPSPSPMDKKKKGDSKYRRKPKKENLQEHDPNDYNYWFWHNWWYHGGKDAEQNNKATRNDKSIKDGKRWTFKWSL